MESSNGHASSHRNRRNGSLADYSSRVRGLALHLRTTYKRHLLDVQLRHGGEDGQVVHEPELDLYRWQEKKPGDIPTSIDIQNPNRCNRYRFVDMNNFYDVLSSPHCILVQGHHGTGKTAFCNRILNDWQPSLSSDSDSMESVVFSAVPFNLVFYIDGYAVRFNSRTDDNCSNIETDNMMNSLEWGFASLISKHTDIPSDTCSENEIYSIFCDSNIPVLILVDGFENITSDPYLNSYFDYILNQDQFQNITFLLTSIPNSRLISTIPTNFLVNGYSIRKSREYLKQRVMQCLKIYPLDDYATKERILQRLQRIREFLESELDVYRPYNVAFIESLLHLICDLDQPPPSSAKYDFFKELVFSHLKWFAKNSSESGLLRKGDIFSAKLINIFEHLRKISYACGKNCKYRICKSDLNSENKNSYESLLCMPIDGMWSQHHTISNNYFTPSYSFHHSSIQIFLAIDHIVCTMSRKDIIAEADVICKRSDAKESLLLLCGALWNKSDLETSKSVFKLMWDILVERIPNVIRQTDGIQLPYIALILECLEEMNFPRDLVKYVASLLPSYIEVKYSQCSVACCTGLIAILESNHSPCLKGVHMHVDGMFRRWELGMSIARAVQECEDVTTVQISSDSVWCSEFLVDFLCLIFRENLHCKFLSLIGPMNNAENLTPVLKHRIRDTFKNRKRVSLETLQMKCYSNHHRLAYIMSLWTQTTVLTSLQFLHCNCRSISPSVCQILKTCTKNFHSLTLDSCFIESEHLCDLIRCVVSIPNLRKLELNSLCCKRKYCCNSTFRIVGSEDSAMTAAVCRGIGEILSILASGIDLIINRNCLDDGCAGIILDAAVHSSIAGKLDLSQNCITDKSAEKIVQVIKKCVDLGEFYLGGNEISADSRRRIIRRTIDNSSIKLAL